MPQNPLLLFFIISISWNALIIIVINNTSSIVSQLFCWIIMLKD